MKPLLATLLLTITSQAAPPKILYQDNFETDLSQWKIEQMPGGSASIKNGKLEILDKSGCTIWFKQKLTGPITITFDATFPNNGEKFDRLSDLNCFWMATDPKQNRNILPNKTRTGKFKDYHSLRLYYVGLGGNNNTTTRFRRYSGDGERPLLPEHDLTKSKFLLKPNQTEKITIIAHGKTIQYLRNGKIIYNFTDPTPLTSGWFAFRTVKTHLLIDNFQVTKP